MRRTNRTKPTISGTQYLPVDLKNWSTWEQAFFFPGMGCNSSNIINNNKKPAANDTSQPAISDDLEDDGGLSR